MRVLSLFIIYFFYSIIKEYSSDLQKNYEKIMFFILNISIGVLAYFILLLSIEYN